MIKEAVNGLMDSLSLPYQYWEYQDTGDGIPNCYFVGERMPDPDPDEDGGESGSFILSGWSRSGLDPLDAAEGFIKRKLNHPDVLRVQNELGSCVLWYSQATDVPSDVEGICRVEITVNYTEWSVV